MAENKVQFGLKNVHYAVLTDGEYGSPVAVPGAVNLSLSAEGDMQKFYADNIAYFVTNTNNGYSGDLEIARIPDQMYQEVFGFKLGETDKVLSEDANAQAVTFALMFQINGDQNDNCFVLYACTATRPDIGGSTIEESTDPKTQTVSLSAVPTAAGKVYAKTTAETPSSVKESWFTAVYNG